MSTACASLDVDVRYNIKVDMVRTGLHRHECTGTTWWYLPRSIPASLGSVTAAFEEVEAKSETENEVQWKMSEVNATGGAQNGHIVQVSESGNVPAGLLRLLTPRSPSSACHYP